MNEEALTVKSKMNKKQVSAQEALRMTDIGNLYKIMTYFNIQSFYFPEKLLIFF